MGVLQCDRNGCENIMCETLVNNQYICEDCKEQFKQIVGTETVAKAVLIDMFEKFMCSEKKHYGENTMITVSEFLRN